MPPPSPALALIGLITLLVLAGILTAWARALAALWRRRPLLPDAPPRRVPWHAGSILGVILLYYLLSTAVDLGYRAVRGPAPAAKAPAGAAAKAEPAPARRPPEELLGLQAAINLGVLALVPLFLWRTTGTTLADLGLADPDWRANLRRGFAAFFLLVPVVYGVMALALEVWPRQPHPVEDMLRRRLDPGTAALALISAVLLAPLTEELLFRGLLLGWLRRVFDPAPRPDAIDPEGFGPATATAPGPAAAPSALARVVPDAVTAALFAALHWGQWPAPVPLFALALGLGVLMRRTGSLWAPIGLHATFNGVSTAMMLLAGAAGVKLGPEGPARPLPAPAVVGAGPQGRAPALRLPGHIDRSDRGDRSALGADAGIREKRAWGRDVPGL
jgi:membrane protease YdiL (CAAX protease family)